MRRRCTCTGRLASSPSAWSLARSALTGVISGKSTCTRRSPDSFANAYLDNLLQGVTNAPVLALSPHERNNVYTCLLRGATRGEAGTDPTREHWNWLMAAHVVGQHDAGLHFDCHLR